MSSHLDIWGEFIVLLLAVARYARPPGRIGCLLGITLNSCLRDIIAASPNHFVFVA